MAAIAPDKPFSEGVYRLADCPPAERRPLFLGKGLPTPPPSATFQPRISSLPRETLADENVPYLGKSPYQRNFLDGNYSETYRLVSRRESPEIFRMDIEVARLRERDARLKRNIRRFRFVLRSLHLCCRLSAVVLRH